MKTTINTTNTAAAKILCYCNLDAIRADRTGTIHAAVRAIRDSADTDNNTVQVHYDLYRRAVAIQITTRDMWHCYSDDNISMIAIGQYRGSITAAQLADDIIAAISAAQKGA